MAEAAPQGRRNVVIPMDGSEHADYALDWYIKYIRRENDHLIVVYVTDFSHVKHLPHTQAAMIGSEVVSAMYHQEQGNIQNQLNKLGDKLKERHVGGEVRHVEAKKPGDGILKAADNYHAQMIIMGSRGLGTVRRTLLGSVSHYVVHNSHIPVGICHHPHHHHEHHHHHHH